MNKSKKDILLDAANTLSTSKFLIWVEEDFVWNEERHLAIDILNRDEVLNLNRDTVHLRVDKWIFTFINGVFQRVGDFNPNP